MSVDNICVLNDAFDGDYTVSGLFENTRRIRIMHEKIPRFGHDNDLLVLVEGNRDEKTDYLTGLLAASISLFVVFIVWSVVLIYFKCCRRRYGGFLSGRFNPLPPKPKPKPKLKPQMDQAKAKAKAEVGDSGSDEPTGLLAYSPDMNLPPFEEAATAAAAAAAPTKEQAPPIQVPTENLLLNPLLGLLNMNPCPPAPEDGLLNMNPCPPEEVSKNDPAVEKKDDLEQADVATTSTVPPNSNEEDKSTNVVPEETNEDIEPDEEKVDALTDWTNNYERVKMRHFYMRVIVFLACTCIVTGSIIMITGGVEGLRRTVTEGTETITLVQEMIQTGIDFMEDLVQAATNVQQDVTKLLEAVNQGICPNTRQNICDNIEDYRTCNNTLFDGTLVLEPMVKFFMSDRSLVSQLQKAKDDFEHLITVADSMQDQAESFDWTLLVAMVFAVLLIFTAVMMMISVVIPHKTPKITAYVQRRFIMPLFIVLVSISFLFAISFIIASSALADTCVDDPDTRLLSIAEVFLNDSSPIVLEFVKLYLSRCEVQPVQVAQHMTFLQEGTDLLNQFSGQLQAFAPRAQEFCNGTIADGAAAITLAGISNTTGRYMCTTATLVREVRSWFSCSTWYPLYQKVVHDTLCYGATDGFSFIATSQFFVVLAAIVVLTFRAALFDIEIMEENDDLLLTEEEDVKEIETGAQAVIIDEKAESKDNNTSKNNTPCTSLCTGTYTQTVSQ